MKNNYIPGFKQLTIIFVLIVSTAIQAQVPVAKFGASKRIIEQYESLQFFDSSTNNPYQWEWNVYDSTTYKSSGYYPNLTDGNVYSDPWGNGNNEFTKNPEFAFDIPGMYTVTLVCKNSTGPSAMLRKVGYIKVVQPTSYYLGYGTYGPNNDNIVESDYGSIFDDGGPNLNYGNNQGYSTRSHIMIKPCNAKTITLKMTQLKFKASDVLSVYDASYANNSKLLAKWTSTNTSGKTVTALSGTMFILFESDGSGVDSGYIGTYTSVLDTATGSPGVTIIGDSVLYNSVPFMVKYSSTGIAGVPTSEWTIDNAQVGKSFVKDFRYTFLTDGKYKICVKVTHCYGQNSACDSFPVVTPNTTTNINFKSSSLFTNSLESVVLTPLTDKANRFEWTIFPTSYQLLNPPASPSSYGAGFIKYNATPGDSFPRPRIKLLDTVCYTVTLKAYNSLNPTNTTKTLVKNSYICGKDYKDYYSLHGKAWFDFNSDCKDSSEPGAENIAIKLYDSSNQFMSVTYTQQGGLFGFDVPNGTYKIRMDVNNTPFSVKCPTGVDTIVTLVNKNFNGVKFDLLCTGNKDLAITAVSSSGIVFPGQVHTLKVNAGLKNNIWCKQSNASGTVKITLSGSSKVTYVGIPSGARTPSNISGKVFTYTISDFNTVNNATDFALNLKTDTNATSADTIRALIEIIPNQSDFDTTNNKKNVFYRVLNSLDPNMKEVTPQNVPPKYNDWLTYTIHFQNTGNAPAFNIRLEDTLDSRLDLETFEMVYYSHANRVSLKNRILKVYFADIMLPDSFTNKKGSMGFVQYRVKPLADLPEGTRLTNTAYIYFDYNTAVVTNTTLNEYVKPSNGITVINGPQLKVYPNPGSGIYKVENPSGGPLRMEVYNTMGVLCVTKSGSSSGNLIDLTQYTDGMYILKIYVNGQVQVVKLLKYQGF